MNLKIDQKIFEQFPEVILGIVILHGVDNTGDHPEISKSLRVEETEAINNLKDMPVAEHPFIIPWRDAYRKFGAKPKDYPSSIENLLRRVLKGEQIRHINKLVDIYNVISLKFLVPVGGEDISKIKGDVVLTIASEKEDPIVLLGETEARPPHSGEVIYKDDLGTICRRWNWKEAERTKLTEQTKDTFIVLEGLPPVDKERIQQAISELSESTKKYCGGNISTTILDKTNPQIEL